MSVDPEYEPDTSEWAAEVLLRMTQLTGLVLDGQNRVRDRVAIAASFMPWHARYYTAQQPAGAAVAASAVCTLFMGCLHVCKFAFKFARPGVGCMLLV